MPSINFQSVTQTNSYPFLSISTPSINILNFNTFPNKILSLTHFNFKCFSSPQPSPSSLDFDSTSFQVSYLVHNFDFSPEFASKLCSAYRLRFKTTENPDAVINFFTNYGFSDSQLRYIISKAPWLLSCNLSKRVLPKFEFFLSKGASKSDILNLISERPRLLCPSLENYIVPTYELLYRFLQSDKDIIALQIKNPSLISHPCVPSYITMLIENGVSNSNIAGLLRDRTPIFYARNTMKFVEEVKNLGFDLSKTTYPFLQSHKDIIACAYHNQSCFRDSKVPEIIRLLIDNGVADSNIAIILRNKNWTLRTCDMVSSLKELKDLGFNPSKRDFSAALTAKTSLTKTRWKEKLDAFKKWGWSDEDVIEAFKKHPPCMLTSIEKIDSVMNFWVNQMGWDVLALAKRPLVFSYSLEQRIIPRASVVQFLLNNGLRDKNASLIFPFMRSEKAFQDRFIKCFEESSYLLKLYEEKLKLASTGDKNCMS